MKIRETIEVSELRAGDMLPGVGNGYVFEVEHEEGVNSFSTRGYDTYLGEFTVVTFHDAEGDENYMILNPNGFIEVERED